ncbi:MAG: hypothetical protein IPM46_09715 [Flavobacteriales bacterium]|nr:hypothetical protein [Flavobacteriales bacterium]
MRLSALIALLVSSAGFTQDTTLVCKNLTAARAMERIVVDGVLDEPSWATAAIGTEFVQNELRPNEPSNYRSEVRVLYSDNAILISAVLYDDPDSVMMRLSGRDRIGITDWFGITFDPYESGRNGFGVHCHSGGCSVRCHRGQRGRGRELACRLAQRGAHHGARLGGGDEHPVLGLPLSQGQGARGAFNSCVS